MSPAVDRALADQDRLRWDRLLIRRGLAALGGGRPAGRGGDGPGSGDDGGSGGIAIHKKLQR